MLPNKDSNHDILELQVLFGRKHQAYLRELRSIMQQNATQIPTGDDFDATLPVNLQSSQLPQHDQSSKFKGAFG